MHGNNPTRDYIEQELTVAADRGLIVSWERLPLNYGGAPKWKVTVNLGPGGTDVGPQSGVTSLGEIQVRTYQEGKLVAAALASARVARGVTLDRRVNHAD